MHCTQPVKVGSREDVAVALGRRIVELRRGKGWSQDQLAYEAGLHRTYMSGIERGKRNPSLYNLLKIATVLDVSLKDLFD